MKSLLIAIGTNKALICYRALILFYSVPFWQFSSKLGNLDWNNGINSSAVMLYKLPGMCCMEDFSHLFICYYLKSTTSVQKLYTHFIHLGCIRMTMRNRTSIYNTSIERVWKNSCIHIWFLKISLFIKGPNIILLSFLFFQILIKGT